MNISKKDRPSAKLRPYSAKFPYVNGGLFAGSLEVPTFSKIARSYLLHIGRLNWKQINPDIFGSMIQAVAEDEERGALGMHYTSVPNILKVLNPLFLDELRTQLEEAGNNKRKLKNLRDRISRIRVFDPACGSGNFLVIAYKEMRAIEAEINERRGESGSLSSIPLTNFRGIELRSFPAEIARLALIIAEYQCDGLYRGNELALEEFLPLDSENWITCGNALRLNWLKICPPTGKGVKIDSDDLFSTPLDQAEKEFDNAGGETFICGNPPYLGSTWQSDEQKSDLKQIFDGRIDKWKSLDYVSGWFMKACNYGSKTACVTALVSTNSICQGQQVPILWPAIFKSGSQIVFAHTSFKWANLASHNAGVTVVIIGLGSHWDGPKRIYSIDTNGVSTKVITSVIGAYLVPNTSVILCKTPHPQNNLPEMSYGNKPVDGGHLLISAPELRSLSLSAYERSLFVKRVYGAAEFVKGAVRYCLWIMDAGLKEARLNKKIAKRIELVEEMRRASRDKGANQLAERPHQFREMNYGKRWTIIIGRHTSENREYIPAGLIDNESRLTDASFAMYDAPLWCLSFIVSKLHRTWVETVCGQLETRIRYSSTLAWNTFPIPKITEKNKSDLTHTAEGILLARESHFPATIADLYDPEKMPDNLRSAHQKNDETLERIYLGRRFKNDTERLEKLFEMYTKMTSKESA